MGREVNDPHVMLLRFLFQYQGSKMSVVIDSSTVFVKFAELAYLVNAIK